MAGRGGAEVGRISAFIPESDPGDSLHQSLFKDDVAIRLGHGETRSEAVRHATDRRRADGDPTFQPVVFPGFWNGD